MDKFRVINKTVSSIQYRFIFCTRYRRPIFNEYDVATYFKKIVKERCKELDMTIISLDCCFDYVDITLDCSPYLSPAEIMKNIRFYTAKKIMERFPHLGRSNGIWTLKFFCSTNLDVDNTVIQRYLLSQNRYDAQAFEV